MYALATGGPVTAQTTELPAGCVVVPLHVVNQPTVVVYKGKRLDLFDELEFSLDLARRRWADDRARVAAGKPSDLGYVVQSLTRSDQFLRAFWGDRWHELVTA